jgi:hypothetical protein
MITSGIITVKYDDADLSTPESTDKFVRDVLSPQIVKVLREAAAAPKTKGCGVSGSASGGPGGASGTITFGCTW